MCNNLETTLKKYPDATIYWAYVIEKNYNSKNEIWEYHEKIKNSDEVIVHYDPNIKVISGVELYTLVTGDSTALKQLINALPDAINFVLINKFGIDVHIMSDDEKNIFGDYVDYIFK